MSKLFTCSIADLHEIPFYIHNTHKPQTTIAINTFMNYGRNVLRPKHLTAETTHGLTGSRPKHPVSDWGVLHLYRGTKHLLSFEPLHTVSQPEPLTTIAEIHCNTGCLFDALTSQASAQSRDSPQWDRGKTRWVRPLLSLIACLYIIIKQPTIFCNKLHISYELKKRTLR